MQRKTLILLLRLRFKLTVHGRRERLLLAEEAGLVALAGAEVIATGAEARALLGVGAGHNLAAVARDRIVAAAHADLADHLLTGPIADYARERAAALLADHARLRGAAGTAPRVMVEPALPPDVIGLFVLLPAGA